MDWLNSVKNSLLPISQDKTNIINALKEWEYRGDMDESEYTDQDCELCGHPNIKYQFTIINKFNGSSLIVGSECILKFSVAVIGEDGEKLSKELAEKKIAKDRNKLIASTKVKSVINALINLAAKEHEVNLDINSFIKSYKDKGAFTPKQLSVILWRLDVNKILYQKKFFKLKMRRDEEKTQLFVMEDWKLKKIWDCLTKAQQQVVINHKKVNEVLKGGRYPFS